MNRKKMINGLGIGMLITILQSGNAMEIAYANVEPLFYNEVALRNELKIEEGTMSNKLVWYYKSEGGKTYKRLYDATDKKWLTDWILCP